MLNCKANMETHLSAQPSGFIFNYLYKKFFFVTLSTFLNVLCIFETDLLFSFFNENVVRCLNSIIPILANFKIPRL